MEIRELEQAIRAAMRMDSVGMARPAMASAGLVGMALPQEFATAFQSLFDRADKRSEGESILQKAFQWV